MIVDTAAKELLFATVRIVNHHPPGAPSVGTGFLLSVKVAPESGAVFLVSNKHVLQNATTLTLGFIACDSTDTQKPAFGQRVDINLPSPSNVITGHPDPEVDIALINLSPVIDKLNGRVFYKAIPAAQMPSDGDDLFIDAVEDVTFIGYPDGRQDPAHLTPIVRQGITATPIELPFAGKPTFLVDGSVFGGSSGSPVFLMNHGIYRSGPTMTAVGNRLALVGIVAATHIRERMLPLVVGTGPHVRLAQELNLGVVYNWHAIQETVNEALANPPAHMVSIP